MQLFYEGKKLLDSKKYEAALEAFRQLMLYTAFF